MPVYKVTTEGDCEGRSSKLIGYVEANSPEHAIKHLESIGKYAYYEYSIDVVEYPVIKAKPEAELEYLIAEVKRGYFGGWRGTVKTNEQVVKQKQEAVLQAMQRAGLSYEDVVNFGKGE